MSEETKQNVKVKSDDFNYDTSWKQNLVMSDDDEQQQIVLVSSDDDEETGDQSQENAFPEISSILNLVLSVLQIDPQELEALVYLDEPGLQMYLVQDPDIQTLFNCFIPKALFEQFQSNLNQNLSNIIRKDYPDESKFQLVLTKKKFGDSEVPQYIGMALLFGVFRLPTVSSYWHVEDFMKGGIEICMQEGRYKFIENNMMLFHEEADYVKAISIAQDIRKKWRKIYRPDQELILMENKNHHYSINYLMDSETLYILDEVVGFESKDIQAQLTSMLNYYSGKNHILYFSYDCMDLRMLLKLTENSIYPVGWISIKSLTVEEEGRMFLNQIHEEGTTYCSNKLCFVRCVDRIMVFPKSKIRSEGSECEDLASRYQEQLRMMLYKAEKRIINIDLYKSPFGYQYQIQQQVIRDRDRDLDSESEIKLNLLKVLFEEYLECTIYNMFSFYNTIIINKQYKLNFKQFKLAVAGCLVGEKFAQLEYDRKEIIRRATLVICQTMTQTDSLCFGLPKSFEKETYHYPIMVDRRALVKYCVVCMKYQNLSKSYYHCHQCWKQIGQKVFVCLTPCFELFHKHPNLYTQVDPRLMLAHQTDLYYKTNQTAAAIDILDQEYKQINHQKPTDFDPDLPAGGRQQTLQTSNRRPPVKPNTLLTNNKPNAKYAPSFYNWSYNRGFKQRTEDAPIEKNFEVVLNNLNQQAYDLLSKPMPNKNIATIHIPKPNKNGFKDEINTSQSVQDSQNRPDLQLSQNKPFNNNNIPMQSVPPPPRQESKGDMKDRKETQKSNGRPFMEEEDDDEQPARQIASKARSRPAPPQEDESFKSPFEKFMDQVKKKNQPARLNKLEEEFA